jgi:hypothetical protein
MAGGQQNILTVGGYGSHRSEVETKQTLHAEKSNDIQKREQSSLRKECEFSEMSEVSE